MAADRDDCDASQRHRHRRDGKRSPPAADPRRRPRRIERRQKVRAGGGIAQEIAQRLLALERIEKFLILQRGGKQRESGGKP
jgi:hypothetical protein